MIMMTFKNQADSPTGSASVRLRYSIARDENGQAVPVLRYAHGSRKLTADSWQGFKAAGASLTVSTDRERSICAQVLKVPADAITQQAQP